MLKKIAAAVTSIALAVGMVALNASSASAVTSRSAGQVNQDFGGSYQRGIAFNTTDFASPGCEPEAYWEASEATGDTVYMSGIERDNCDRLQNNIIVQKWVNGAIDTSFGTAGTARYSLESATASVSSVNGITIAENGELVILGGLYKSQYNGIGYAFALRVSESGSTTIAGSWGNSLGAALDDTDVLALSAFKNPELTAGIIDNYDEPEAWFNKAVQYYDADFGQLWAITGETYDTFFGEDRGFVATIDDTGNLRTGNSYGNSVIDGFSYMDANLTDSGEGIDCGGYWSEMWDIEYNPVSHSVFALGDCDGRDGIIMKFSAWNLEQTAWGSDSDGLVVVNDLSWDYFNTAGDGEARLMESYTSGGVFYLKLAGENYDGGLWTGTLAGATGNLVNEDVMSSTLNLYSRALTVDSSGNAFIGGSGSDMTGSTDGFVVHVTTAGAFDSAWASNADGISWFGNCGDETVNSLAVTTNEGIFASGEGTTFDGAEMSYTTTMVANLFGLSGGSQTLATGAEPTVTGGTWLNSLTVNTSYSDGVSATGATPLRYGTDNSWPTGISLSSTTGAITGTPTATGTVSQRVCISNQFGARWTDWGQIEVTEAAGSDGPTFSDESYTLDTFVGDNLDVSITAAQGDGGLITFSYVGDLPPGVSYYAEGNTFLGIPTETGTFSGTITAQNSVAPNDTAAVSFVVVEGDNTLEPGRPDWFTDTEIPDLTSGEPVDYQIYVYGNDLPTCSVTEGDLPAGLVLDEDTCAITGTPLFPGEYSFVITALNDSGSYDFEYSGTTAGDGDHLLALSLDLELGSTVEGADVSLGGQGLQADSEWRAEFHSTPVVIADGVASIDGNFYFVAQLPSDIEPGQHEIILFGVDPDGNPIQTSTYITVGASGELTYIGESPVAPSLPNTGLNGSSMAFSSAIASTLVALGAVMLLIRRRLT